MSTKTTFGEWLDDRLREHGWKQTAFARMLDVAPSTVNAWVNDVSPPRRRVCARIADLLNVSRREVLERAGYDPDPGETHQFHELREASQLYEAHEALRDAQRSIARAMAVVRDVMESNNLVVTNGEG
jgi:transcriptional regulator with XRE-family HTH domain